jgi:hypothetical protein
MTPRLVRYTCPNDACDYMMGAPEGATVRHLCPHRKAGSPRRVLLKRDAHPSEPKPARTT